MADEGRRGQNPTHAGPVVIAVGSRYRGELITGAGCSPLPVAVLPVAERTTLREHLGTVPEVGSTVGLFYILCTCADEFGAVGDPGGNPFRVGQEGLLPAVRIRA